MDAGFTELTVLRDLAGTASLTPEAKQVTLYCMDQLPKVYEDFRRTNESRFGDGVASLVHAVLKRLGEPSAGPDAGRVAAALVACLGELHERLGLAPLRYKATAAPGPTRRKRTK
jgi:hypothetical protein